MSDITHVLAKIESGDPAAAEKLLPLVYDELRQLAAAKLAHERPGHTLQATALVHEAYLRLVAVEKAQSWDSRRHFFAAAAEAMRRILVDSARRKLGENGTEIDNRVDLNGRGGRRRFAWRRSSGSPRSVDQAGESGSDVGQPRQTQVFCRSIHPGDRRTRQNVASNH